MFQVVRRFMLSLLALWVAFGSLCTVTGIEAVFAAADNAHAHHHAEMPHEGNHGHAHHKTPDNGHGDHDSCCEGGHGMNGVVTVPYTQVQTPSVVPSPAWHHYWSETDSLLQRFALDQIRFQRQSNAPPDNTERRESERDSAQLLL